MVALLPVLCQQRLNVEARLARLQWIFTPTLWCHWRPFGKPRLPPLPGDSEAPFLLKLRRYQMKKVRGLWFWNKKATLSHSVSKVCGGKSNETSLSLTARWYQPELHSLLAAVVIPLGGRGQVKKCHFCHNFAAMSNASRYHAYS